MLSKTKTLALSALVAFAAFSSAPTAANAGDIKIDVHFGAGFGHGFGFGPGHGYGYGPKHCTPGKALHKAKSMGLKKAYVAKAGWNGVVVKGKKFGQKHVVAFGKAPFCPVKYWH